MGIAAVAMASCDEPAPSVPPIQENPQGPVFETSDVYGTVEGPIAQGSLDLQAYTEQPTIEVYKLDSISNVPEGTTASIQLQISNTESFEASQTIDTENEGKTFTVNTESLENAFTNLFGKLYKEKDVYYRLLGYLNTNGVTYRIGGTDYYLASGSYKGLPFDRGSIENLWTPGNSNGWNQSNSQMLFTENYVDYMGYAHLDGDFKLTTQPNWDGTNYGNGGDGTLSADGGAGNLWAPGNGLYWITANLETLHYDLYAVNTIGIIGDATDEGWDASTPLTADESFLKWSAVVNFKGAGNWKFRANNDWAVNLGLQDDKLIQNGPDIPTPGEGTYLLTLDLTKLPYTYTAVKQ